MKQTQISRRPPRGRHSSLAAHCASSAACGCGMSARRQGSSWRQTTYSWRTCPAATSAWVCGGSSGLRTSSRWSFHCCIDLEILNFTNQILVAKRLSAHLSYFSYQHRWYEVVICGFRQQQADTHHIDSSHDTNKAKFATQFLAILPWRMGQWWLQGPYHSVSWALKYESYL